ncbi:hypothetical protein Efla_004740 [Eimeria flavescens]
MPDNEAFLSCTYFSSNQSIIILLASYLHREEEDSFRRMEQAGAPSVQRAPGRVSCLDAMNPYRQATGFSAFESHEIFPVTNTIWTKPGKDAESNLSSFLTAVCTSMQTASPTNLKVAKTVKASFKEDATYAVHVQTGQMANCSAAVDHWKEALVNFGRLPPAYNADSEPYNDLQNVSFVALFNPKARAKIDCAYVTCPRRAAKPQTALLVRTDDPVANDAGIKQDEGAPQPDTVENDTDSRKDTAERPSGSGGNVTDS